MEYSSNKGFTLIELLIGISVMTVVGLMITSLLGSSTRLYRSTMSFSNLQTESQAVSRRISSAVMEADSLYLNQEEKGTYLFTGESNTENGKKIYSGRIIWFNKETGCLYQNSSFQAEEGSEASGILTIDTVRTEIEESSAGKGREYLISDKVNELEFEIYPELTKEQQIREGENYYKTDGNISVHFDITFHDPDSKDYRVNTSAAPRNKLSMLWRSGVSISEAGENGEMQGEDP